MSENPHPLIHMRSLVGGRDCPSCGMTVAQFQEQRRLELLEKHKIVHGHCICGCPHSCQRPEDAKGSAR